MLFGALAAFAGLCVYVYSETEFSDDWTPPFLIALFILAALVAARTRRIRRWLTPTSERHAAVRAAAREAFVDQGIAATRDRTGLLIYVNVFEQRAEVVLDLGLLRRDTDGALARKIDAVAATIRDGADLDAFEAAVREVGGLCAALCPPRADDVNELPDAPDVE